MTNKPQPMLSKILRPGGMAANSIILECDGIKIEVDVYRTRVLLAYEDRDGETATIQFAPKDGGAVAAVLRAAADELEKL